jgi:hypothetical protein
MPPLTIAAEGTQEYKDELTKFNLKSNDWI